MFRKVTLFGFALAAMALSLICSAQTPSVVAGKLYDQIDQTWANHDAKQLLALLDPSFTVVDEKGNHKGFAEYSKMANDLFANEKFKNFSSKTTIKDVNMQAGHMVVYYSQDLHYQLQSTSGWEPVLTSSSQEDTWQKTGGSWKLVSNHVIRLSTAVDRDWLVMKHQEIMNKLGVVQHAADSVLRPCVQSIHGC